MNTSYQSQPVLGLVRIDLELNHPAAILKQLLNTWNVMWPPTPDYKNKLNPDQIEYWPNVFEELVVEINRLDDCNKWDSSTFTEFLKPILEGFELRGYAFSFDESLVQVV